ncbi:helix-turn-helix transcriptional regulator, partial [Clostridioides difficile]|nr:helix-turn-helix transcriptional regulator [Clostridioides difficile]
MEINFNGERLKKARIYRGMTVAELAERIDCQRQTVSMYENNKS